MLVDGSVDAEPFEDDPDEPPEVRATARQAAATATTAVMRNGRWRGSLIVWSGY
jgi:hypothetical protein